MSRRRQNWTDAEDDLLRHLSASGSRPREIGERIGRSESAVRNRMKMLRISRRGGHVRKYANWSEEELAALRELHEEAMVLTEVAERLGRARTGVTSKVRELELWRTNPPADADIPVEAGDPGPKRPVRAFGEIERRRIRQFLARGDTLADIARQMRCEIADIKRVKRSAKGLPHKPG
ncbi:MAG: hypothetical protein OXF88_02020 [Rhodobacteraceae bacterium]|nr:hypothetical protein [Paracoccaceae bacterium]MCY4140650.1 hypothetical protein [Paracoccaceae bacterium]